jgi:hypothetical protein
MRLLNVNVTEGDKLARRIAFASTIGYYAPFASSNGRNGNQLALSMALIRTINDECVDNEDWDRDITYFKIHYPMESFVMYSIFDHARKMCENEEIVFNFCSIVKSTWLVSIKPVNLGVEKRLIPTLLADTMEQSIHQRN